MKLKHLYILSKEIENKQSNKVIIKNLAEVLGISERYMQSLLKEFERDNHITLIRGNGRGNQSELKINYSKLQIAKMYVKHLQKLDKTSLALDFIKEEELISNNDF